MRLTEEAKKLHDSFLEVEKKIDRLLEEYHGRLT
jgi:hypothetical protein